MLLHLVMVTVASEHGHPTPAPLPVPVLFNQSFSSNMVLQVGDIPHDGRLCDVAGCAGAGARHGGGRCDAAPKKGDDREVVASTVEISVFIDIH
jgi:hypothetical protein